MTIAFLKRVKMFYQVGCKFEVNYCKRLSNRYNKSERSVWVFTMTSRKQGIGYIHIHLTEIYYLLYLTKNNNINSTPYYTILMRFFRVVSKNDTV